MTDLGKIFADITATILRNHDFGSNKMTTGYTVRESKNYEPDEYTRDKAELLEQLVCMGYLRKFTTNPFLNNRTRNWRYRQMVRNVCFGLTQKGWAVAEQYVTAAYGIEEFKRICHYPKTETMSDDDWIADWDKHVN